MDFVDLDKVLDQFEEEEKAAGEILPGQEIKPSGYAEYLAAHQDKPWETLSYAPSVDPVSKQSNIQPHIVAYDAPYESFDKSVGESQNSLKQLGSYSNSSYVDHQYNQNGTNTGQSFSLEQELSQAKLKQETIESYLPQVQMSNGFDQMSGTGVNGSLSLDIHKREEDEKRGLIASQPASIQTDTLSPASEQELLSFPLPKSDILVVGHGQEDTEPKLYTEQDTECKRLDNGISTVYAAANSIETQQLTNTKEAPVYSQMFVNSHINDDASISDQAADSATDIEKRFTADVHEESIDNSCVVKENCTPSPSSEVTVPDGSRSVSDVTSANSVQEEAAAESKTKDTLPQSDSVGFETDECEMDKEEVDAYLQDLEETGMSGDGAVQVAALSVAPPLQEDTSQAAVAQQSTEDSVATKMQDEIAQSSGSQAFVTDSGIRSDSTAVSTVDSDSAGNSKNVRDGMVVDHLHSVSERTKDLGMVVDKKDHSMDNLTDGNNSSVLDVQQPDVVADINHRASDSDMQTEFNMDTDQTKLKKISDSVLNEDNKLTDNTSLSFVGTNQTGMSSRENNNRQRENISLEFPVTNKNSELSSAMKGKLEIEGLLDEIVAARLAQKSMELTTAEVTQVVHSDSAIVEQSALRESGTSDKNRTLGWGPEGSMVCSRVRESSSESPAESGSPSPTLGIGARPKDPSQMKKNRPNSLLGLSKISLASPFSPPQQCAGPAIGVMLPSAQQQQTGEGGRTTLPLQTEVQSTEGEGRTQLQSLGVRHLGAPPPVVNTSTAATMHAESAPAHSAMETSTVEDEELEAPVMRRTEIIGDGGMAGEGVEASSGMQRPQSWSPSTMSSPPAQKMKRPTSLNLPVRQDRVGSVSPDGENPRSRKAGFLQEAGLANETGSSEEESMAVGGTDSYGNEDLSGMDPEELEGAAAAAELSADAPPPSILHLNLGKIAPTWVPDADALTCMQCGVRFTFTKRRHHCRACGKIFCSACCGQKSRLTYLENKEGRVCVSCYQVLASADCVSPAGVSCRSPNPNNPIEYCSTVPPTQQANARAPLPTVMVPTGVLKRQGSNKKGEPKQVMFSDGIRPGGDLTELDGSDQARIPPRRTGRAQKKVEKQQGDHTSAKTRRLRGNDGMRNPCLIPDEGLPPVVVHTDDKGEVNLSENPDQASLMIQIKDEEASPVIFAINLNLFVQVKIINLDCCVNRVVWCFTTRGMVTAGQEELVIVLETLPDEDTVPRDIFCHFSTVYEEASKGNTVSSMGHSIFNQPFLDNRSHGGLLYIRSTFQCTNKLILPSAPFLFAILLQKWETPWAKVFPIRLMLRLGAEYRYYPSPLVSIRNRKPVFYEIGHTIMNLLADFRNFQYMLQQIRGVTVHMEDKKTFINFPRNRYEDVMKVVGSSNEHVMALGASFSLEADSHLVCIQNEEGNYQTQAINIQNKPRQVTGASFVVFNGALKSSSGLRAKSSIVEDGLMIQIMPEMMVALKQSMKDMTDFTIGCGSVTIPQPEEVVTVRWVDDDKNVNMGVKSPVDGMSMEGVESVQVHNATDYVGERFAIRWTEVFFLQTENGSSRWEPVDLSRVAETLATAVCIALTPHLQKLRDASLTKIGLRVTLQPDSVGYEVGSKGERLPDFYMNDLDNALIPVIHRAITQSQDGPIVLELILYVIH